jgi:1-acyl-sn-glycerol-3-phosphate acyltransferase
MLDPVLVGMCFDRGCSYLARETLFKVPILGWLIRNLSSFPVPRESTAPKKALEVSINLLAEGRALLLFPEGTRSYDGRLQPLKRGIALVARRSQAPVVPALVHGAYRSWPRTRRLPRPAAVRIFFGEPIQFDPMESSDSFVDRLSASYRQLAIEAGATEVLGEASGLLPLAADGASGAGRTTQPANSMAAFTRE